MGVNALERPIEGELVALSGDVATVRSAQVWPPGARVTAVFFGVTVHGKIVGARRAPERGFVLSVRLSSLSRTERAALQEGLAGASKPV